MISTAMKDEIVEKIATSVNPLKIYLFGSYAYGTPGPDSDLDLAVILPIVSSKFSLN